MKILIITELVFIFGILKYIFDIKWMNIIYSVHVSNEYLGLKPDDKSKYLIHKTKLILGIEFILSFIGKEGLSSGFDSYEEAKEYLKQINNGKI
jgi:hypothetical protein